MTWGWRLIFPEGGQWRCRAGLAGCTKTASGAKEEAFATSLLAFQVPRDVLICSGNETKSGTAAAPEVTTWLISDNPLPFSKTHLSSAQNRHTAWAYPGQAHRQEQNLDWKSTWVGGYGANEKGLLFGSDDSVLKLDRGYCVALLWALSFKAYISHSSFVFYFLLLKKQPEWVWLFSTFYRKCQLGCPWAYQMQTEGHLEIRGPHHLARVHPHSSQQEFTFPPPFPLSPSSQSSWYFDS